MKEIIINTMSHAGEIVNSKNTARALGSGALDVYATPAMVALMEKATCLAAEHCLSDGETTVGTQINVKHTRASGIDSQVLATARLVRYEGRCLTFAVEAADESGKIGNGEIERFVVDSERFMKKVTQQ